MTTQIELDTNLVNRITEMQQQIRILEKLVTFLLDNSPEYKYLAYKNKEVK